MYSSPSAWTTPCASRRAKDKAWTSFSVPARTGTQRAELILFSNDPNEPELAIPVEGFGRESMPGGFLDVAGDRGVSDQGASFGAAWADYDGDGDPDLYVVRSLQANLLYRNDGDGFTELARRAGVADDGDGSAAAWADHDGDGDLDLYVTNFGQPNRLYRNDGSVLHRNRRTGWRG